LKALLVKYSLQYQERGWTTTVDTVTNPPRQRNPAQVLCKDRSITTTKFDILDCPDIFTIVKIEDQGEKVREIDVVTKYSLVIACLAVTVSNASAQDAAKGEQIFKQCMTCHRIGPDAKNLIGPVLTGVIGRQSGTAPGFAYSALNKAAGENGLVWSNDLIMQYLPDPNAFLKKFLTDKGKPELATGVTKMTFHLSDEQQRKDVIAYIDTFSEKKN
jgi:cytochrome c